MPHLPSLAADATLVDVFKRHPEVAAPLLALHEAVMRGPSPFTPAEREALAAYVSTLNACAYCQGVHTEAARNLEGGDAAVETLCELPPGDSPKLAPVMAYAAKLTTAPASVEAKDVARILEAGWDETAVAHACLVAALYGFMNRLVEGHGIGITEDYAKTGGKRLADIGYAGLAALLAGQKP
jgi:uncharacterized peroxidase-related enzyme